MNTFKEANQVRNALKNTLSQYYWYVSSGVFSNQDEFFVLIEVDKLDNFVRKIIPPIINGITVRTELSVKGQNV